VTAILPRGRAKADIPCAAGYYSLNGNGEMTGILWIEESGELQTPITITNTHSCGVARDATIKWLVRHGIGAGQDWGLPVAAETFDGELNDINGFHLKDEHVLEALDKAAGGALELGSVGGGTGMICYDFKGGNGTSSRLADIGGRSFTVGVFVQANFGMRHELTVLGVAVGRRITGGELRSKPQGSIIAIVATDAPLMPHQLKRLARRVPLGMARTGAIGHNGSGDIFLAFSTANEAAYAPTAPTVRALEALSTEAMDPLFEATVEATEEAIIDSMVANATMTGRDGNTSIALPHDKLMQVMQSAGSLG
jgi:L-aminopeptidase/D-esterase-like protein